MALKGEKEKPKSGYVQGVAYANGKGGYIPFVNGSAKSYAGQDRAKAAMKAVKGA